MQRREIYKKMIADNTPGKEQMREIILARSQLPAVKRKRRLRIILASAFIAIMLAGAAVYNNYESIFVDFDGNIYVIPFFPMQWSETEQERRFTIDFFNSNAGENAVLYRFREYYENFLSMRMPEKRFDDYEELKNFLGNHAQGEYFKLPEYIPAGFRLREAVISFRLPEDIDYEALEPVLRKEKFGNIYEKYILPEMPENISRIRVVFVRGSFLNERIIDLFIFFDPSNATGFWGLRGGEPEVLDMEQFERSVLTVDGRNNWSFYGMTSIEPFNILRNYHIMASRIGREREDEFRRYCDWRTGDWRDEKTEMGFISHRINSRNISREQLMKIAESIR